MIACGLLFGLGLGPAATPDELEFSFPALELTVSLPAVASFEPLHDEAGADGRLVHWWKARLGTKVLSASLSTFDAAEWSLFEPGDVTELVVRHQRGKPWRFEVREEAFEEGAFGYAPFASVVVADATPTGRTAVAERHFLMGGLLPDAGYVLHVVCRPLPDEEEQALIRAFLLDVTYGGAERDPAWTADEVLARWADSAPPELQEDFRRAMRKQGTAKRVCIRTANYIVLTNASGGKLFARELERNHARIVDAFPFAQVEGRRLLPIFLFKTKDQYYDFYVRNAGVDREQARKSKGHAYRDYYATWYEAPKDPVHLHEQVHQAFANRLRLGGGGSWFQEGVATYLETDRNDRNVVARTVRDGDATPLSELVRLPSLLYATEEDTRGGSRANEHYRQAALLIEFLRESDFGAGKFEAFLRTLGKVRANDPDEIEAGFRRVYGVGLEGLEAAWRRYCEGR